MNGDDCDDDDDDENDDIDSGEFERDLGSVCLCSRSSSLSDEDDAGGDSVRRDADPDRRSLLFF